MTPALALRERLTTTVARLARFEMTVIIERYGSRLGGFAYGWKDWQRRADYCARA